MTVINIKQTLFQLPKHLTKLEQRSISLQDNSSHAEAIMNIDGVHCNTMIHLRNDGRCDVEYVFKNTKKCIINHYEFLDENKALLTLSKEVKAAVKRCYTETRENA